MFMHVQRHDARVGSQRGISTIARVIFRGVPSRVSIGADRETRTRRAGKLV